jgi:putative tricarboxylic transport membrane protein
MSKRFKSGLVLALSLVFLIVFAAGCTKKTDAPKVSFPEKDIEVVYHSSAGSGGDIFLRTMGKAVEPGLGKAWVVNNKPGASGANAWNYVKKAKADGYTLLGISSTLVTSPILNKMDVNFRDFEPVCMMFLDPMVLFVPANSPLNSIKDLVEAGKKNPGKIKFAGGVPGELGFVAGQELMKAAGFQMALVPFEGGGDAAVTVLGGHIDGGIGEYAEIASNVEAGKLKIIGSFNKMPLRSDVQTVAEAGYPQVKIEKLRGVLAPKGTPKEAIDVVANAMKKALDNPDFKKYYEASNLIPAFKTGSDFTKVMEDQETLIKAAVGN